MQKKLKKLKAKLKNYQMILMFQSSAKKKTFKQESASLKNKALQEKALTKIRLTSLKAY